MAKPLRCWIDHKCSTLRPRKLPVGLHHDHCRIKQTREQVGQAIYVTQQPKEYTFCVIIYQLLSFDIIL